MTIKTGERLSASDIQNLTFFPKGTILMYDGQLWDRAGGIPGWHICDGEEGTINLQDKFIRGGTTARQTGGTDTAQVPYHTHNITDPGHNHTITDPGHTHTIIDPGHTHSIQDGYQENEGQGVDTGRNAINSWPSKVSNAVTGISINNTKTGISISNTNTKISISYAGSSNPDNRPAFCNVVFIEKMTNYLE